MKYQISQESFNKTKADITAVLVVDKNLEHRWVLHKDTLKELGYKSESEEVAFLNESKVIYIGISSLEYDELRNAAALIYKNVSKTKAKSLKIGSYLCKCDKLSIQALIEGFELGSYKFDKYKSEKNKSSLKKVIISLEEYNEKKINKEKANLGLKYAQIIANATNYAKDIVNTIPNDYTPLSFEKDANELAKEHKNVTCKVYDEKFLEKEKMQAFLAVNRASPIPPRLIHLCYKPENAKKKIVFVGKGLTYDSGGLSLKPADYMLTMKADKSGGAAALGIFKAASELEFPFEIHAIIGATENMIGGNAYKPDDVLIARNGKSIEVRNTDAEGRLVLADCLDFAQDLKPDFIFDLATLTGACVVAVGEFTSGVMGHSDELRAKFEKAAKKSGELTSNLYFNKHLKKLIKSQIADVSNTSSSRYGGAITAGLFLDTFIREENKNKWLHLDIAGPAFIEKEWGYNQHGASGAGVRMCVYFLNELAKEI